MDKESEIEYWVRVIFYDPNGGTHKIERWEVHDRETGEMQVEFIGSNRFQRAILEVHEHG